jgi:RNA polymerase sporulation-specific sigma factor
MNQEQQARQKRDLALLAKVAAGENTAMEELLELYKGLVRYKASSMFMAGADAEDVIQEGMIGLFKAIRDYKPDQGMMFSSFAGYCIMSQITDAVRRASRQKHRPLNESLPLHGSVSPDADQNLQWLDLLAAQNQNNPEQRLLNQEKQQLLQKFIQQRLSQMERKIVLLYMQSLTYQQIASCIGCSVKSVDNALHRVRNKMKMYRQDDRF